LSPDGDTSVETGLSDAASSESLCFETEKSFVATTRDGQSVLIRSIYSDFPNSQFLEKLFIKSPAIHPVLADA